MALEGGPAGPIGCSPRPNTNMRRAPEPRPTIPGATTSTSTASLWPIAMAAAASGTASRPRRSARSRQRVWPLRHGRQRLGVDRRLLARTTTTARPRTARHGRRAIACYPCRPRRFLEQQSRQPPLRRPQRGHTDDRAATSASGSPGRLPLESLSLYLLGPGAKPLAGIFLQGCHNGGQCQAHRRGARGALSVPRRGFCRRSRRFPRSHKFTLGDRIETIALDVLEALIEATYTQGSAQTSCAAQIWGSRNCAS